MAAPRLFEAPIPGQSLTDTPKNAPWENPPELNTVEEATAMYIGRLAKQEVVDDLAAIVELGVPLKPIVESIYMQGVMRGLHTIDVGLLVAPVISSFLKQAIESQGVAVKETGDDPEKKANEAEMRRFKALTAKYLSEEGNDMADEGKAMLSEIAEEEQQEEPEIEDIEMEEVAPKGLMAKG